MCWKNNFFDGFALNIVIEWMCYAIQNKKIFGLFLIVISKYNTLLLQLSIIFVWWKLKPNFNFFSSIQLHSIYWKKDCNDSAFLSICCVCLVRSSKFFAHCRSTKAQKIVLSKTYPRLWRLFDASFFVSMIN